MFSSKAPITLPMTMSRLPSDNLFLFSFLRFLPLSKWVFFFYSYDIWCLTSIHPSKVICDSHRATGTCKMFCLLCSWWFSGQRQGPSPTGKPQLKLPPPTRALLAAKGWPHHFFYPLISLFNCVLLGYYIGKLKSLKTKQGVVSRVRCPHHR